MKKGSKDVVELIALIVLVIALIAVFGIKCLSKSAEVISFELYTVHPGDTLWDIAKEYTQGDDPRELIYEIETCNDITPDIRPGQEIKIPIYEKGVY